ncbi:MAG: hypothetical protein U1F35_22515 [Steroidobacteraceae bacterium]
MISIETTSASDRRRRHRGARRAGRSFLRFVHAQRPSAHLEAIGLLDGRLRIRRWHVDEAEAARAAGLAIHHQLHGFHLSMPFEQLADFVFSRRERKIPHVNRRHSRALTA